MNEKLLKVEQSGGDSLIQHPPIFSHDGKVLFCTCGSEVKIFSTETGECVQRLIGHENDVTGIAIHPAVKLQVITSSLDGTVRTWDYEDGILLKTCTIGHPLVRVYTCPDSKTHILLVTKEPNVGNLLKMPVEKIGYGDMTGDPELVVLAEGITRKIANCAGFLLDGKYAVFCIGKCIRIQSLKNKNHFVDHESRKHGKVSSLACHPTDDCFATGHNTGIIKFWHNVTPKKGKQPKPVVSHVHWHHSFVQDIAFTSGGSSLLSIGSESVIVQWHFKQQGDKKDVFPRLGGQARHIAISPDAMLYATTLRSNAAMIITNSFKIRHSIEGFTATNEYTSDQMKLKMLEYDWKTRSCVTIGKPGHLLFYKPHSDTLLYNLDITHKNYISGDPAAREQQSIITHVAFSRESKAGESRDDPMNCTWMATIEEIPNNPPVQDRKLKFWIFDEMEQWWKLNTVINDPHKSTVTRITFRPSSDSVPALLTTGTDAIAKIWEISDNGDDSNIFWSCCNVASYRKFPAYDGDFSQDGSLVAIGFGHVICMCEADNIQDIPLLFSFGKGEEVKRVLFGRHSCQHMMMMASENSLQSLDLLSGSIAWTVDLRIDHLVRDPLSDVMAVIAEKNALFVFNPGSSLPIYTHKQISRNEVSSAAFVPYVTGQNSWLGNCSEVSWMRSSRFFFTDSKMAVFTLCTDTEAERKRQMSTITGSLAVNMESVKAPLASVLQNSKFEEGIDVEGSTAKGVSRREQLAAIRKITDTPCHLLPPMTSLSKQFLLALLPKKAQKQAETSESIDSSDPTDGDTETSTARESEKEVSLIEKKLAEVDINDIINANYDEIFEGLWE